jgi:hypothetical protein
MRARSVIIAIVVVLALLLTVIVGGALLIRYAWDHLPSILQNFFGEFLGYGRGVGTLPTCGAGLVYDGGLCYTPCQANYTGVGPVCWENCPATMKDVGVTCQKNSYGRGAGKVPTGCPVGQENDGGLCYSDCKTNYTGAGPVCWEDCPPGMKDVGISCQKATYSRGSGTVPTACPPGQENDSGLCYPDCEAGYQGVGPVCWQECPPGFADTGADCLKPPSWGRGGGYISQGDCQSAWNKPCEQWGALWYPSCGPDYHNVGCCVCSPNCPPGMADIGVSCQKGSYGRGGGHVPTGCPPGKENQNGLCYTPCAQGYYGVGPVCWESCPADMRDTGADCLKNSYGRGAGKIPTLCPPGQQNDSGLCYLDCSVGYTGAGPVCWQNCPPDMHDTGADCLKNTYGRGVGTIPDACPTGQESDAGLCYPDCKQGYSGVGPVCWRDWSQLFGGPVPDGRRAPDPRDRL